MTQMTLDEARQEGEAGMRQVAENAGEEFAKRAAFLISTYLEVHGSASSEAMVDACTENGIRPHDARAFGPVIASMARRGLIVKAGTCPRRKGHGTAGGTIWRLA